MRFHKKRNHPAEKYIKEGGQENNPYQGGQESQSGNKYFNHGFFKKIKELLAFDRDKRLKLLSFWSEDLTNII
jgi:hypothetical protein